MVLETGDNAINAMDVVGIFQEEDILIWQQYGMNIPLGNRPINNCQRSIIAQPKLSKER